jgi:hypothetical protein
MKLRERKSRLLAFILVSIGIVSLFLIKGVQGPIDFDEGFHFDTIEAFSRQLPYPDIVSTESATSPLWHLSVAAMVKSFGFEVPTAARVSSLLFSVAFLFVLVFYLLPEAKVEIALPVAVMVAFQPTYIWLSTLAMTEIPALFFTGTVLAIVLSERPSTNFTGVAVALLLGAAVWTRQTWIALTPLVLFSLVDWKDLSLRELMRSGAVVFLVLTAAIAGVLFYLWGGLSPPGDYDTNHSPELNLEQLYFGAALFCFYYWPLAFSQDFNTKYFLGSFLFAISALVFFPSICQPFLDGEVLGNPQGALQGAYNLLGIKLSPWVSVFTVISMIWVGAYALVTFITSKVYRQYDIRLSLLLCLTLVVILVIPQVWERYWLSFLVFFPLFYSSGLQGKRAKVILWLLATYTFILGVSYSLYQLTQEGRMIG